MAFKWSPLWTFAVIGAFVLLQLLAGRLYYHSSSDLMSFVSKPVSSAKIPREQKWLMATMCPAKAVARRSVIRSTWQDLYQNDLYETRFVLSNYDDIWDPLIQKENETYGDIIKLDWLDPSPEVSNRIKTMELFKYLVDNGMNYAWVSKVDDDSFLEADKFYNTFLNVKRNKSEALISLKNRNDYWNYFDWPGGAFYTLSWGLVKHIVDIHKQQQDLETPEDVRVGKYLYDAKVDFEFVPLQRAEMLEIPIKGARIPHKINNETVLVHFLKDEETYLRVANIFDKNGYTGQKLEDWTESS